MLREIVKIDEELCDGCGLCVQGCHEGALQLIEGKAKIVNEIFCDGLGACLGMCPQMAITIEKKDVPAYDEIATIKRMLKGHAGVATAISHLRHLKKNHAEALYQEGVEYLRKEHPSFPFEQLEESAKPAPKACPSAIAQKQKHHEDQGSGQPAFALEQWPVQLGLIMPQNPVFRDADVLIAADCCAFAYGKFHSDLMQGRKLLIGCPKLDSPAELENYERKIMTLIDETMVRSLTVAIMEVPCCSGLSRLIARAMSKTQRKVPLEVVTIGIQGAILERRQEANS